ncbi:TIGR02265 family protein [Melittangium boletus]|uniref:TIGR02265 family protein n=1 Tax=Melittangium boletus TaxID=83453 RepID=UPI003DA53C3B
MSESRPQLLSRLDRSTREQTIPGMFLQAVIASAEVHGVDVVERARARVGMGEPLVESYRYPVSCMLEMLDIIGQVAESRGTPYGEALFQSGRAAGLAYVRSAVGRMRAMVAAPVGLHRALEGIPNAATLAVNFGERSYRRLTHSSGELAFQQDLIGAAWNIGMVTASTSAGLSLGPEELKFDVSVTDDDASSFLLRLYW